METYFDSDDRHGQGLRYEVKGVGASEVPLVQDAKARFICLRIARRRVYAGFGNLRLRGVSRISKSHTMRSYRHRLHAHRVSRDHERNIVHKINRTMNIHGVYH